MATAKGAIERQMLSLIKLEIANGVSINGTATRFKELAYTQFYGKELVYYDFAAQVKAYEAKRRGEPHGAANPALAGHPRNMPRRWPATPPPAKALRGIACPVLTASAPLAPALNPSPAGENQPTISDFAGFGAAAPLREPLSFGGDNAADIYYPSPSYLADLFLASTELERA